MDELIHSTNHEKKGEMIVFASAKGGVGKTVISVNLAVAFAEKGFSTCILDGNLQFGDVNLALDLQPKLTISDLVQDINSINNTLPNYLQTHESGVRVLSAPTKPEYADLVAVSTLQIICRKILEQNDFLIVDLSAGLSENNIRFMELADKVFIVTDLEMAALKNTKTMIKTLDVLEMNKKISVVVNRQDMESIIKAKDAAALLEMENLFYVSNDFKVVSKSFNIGIPFVISKPKERISNEINIMASKITNKKSYLRNRRRKKKSIFDILKKGRT